MAEKNKKKKLKIIFRRDKEKKKDALKELKIAYRSLEDPKKYKKRILLPLILLGLLVFCMPFILELIVPISLDLNPITFVIGGTVPIFLVILYPYLSWKNKEGEINGKMHFFITHLRVLAISDLSLKDIINILAGKKAYGSLGKELEKISVLSTQWRTPLVKSFRFVADRTPSRMLKDFLDRFSQSLVSGVDHREFIEQEQGAVLQEYKTMYESSNENIIILSEVYVSLLIGIIFVMSFGIVLPIIIGAQDMNTFIYLSSFMLIICEGMLLYLLRSMIPLDEIWHRIGKKGEVEKSLYQLFKSSVLGSLLLGSALFFAKYSLSVPIIQIIPFEIIVAISLTPLIIPGIKTYRAEEDISRKERSFLGFLPSLGSISAMRGGKITASVYYLSEKDYGILTKHIKDLYKRLRTMIDDDAAWEWFAVDTGSNYIQHSGDMFREATYAAANPRNVAKMITENIRKIRDLRVKKLMIIKTSISLFAGITFGIAFCIYVSLIIARHLNTILQTGMAGRPFEGTTINMGAILSTVPPEVFNNSFIMIFIVLIIHSFMLAITIRTLRGSHILITLLYFVSFVWVVAITATATGTLLGSLLAA